MMVSMMEFPSRQVNPVTKSGEMWDHWRPGTGKGWSRPAGAWQEGCVGCRRRRCGCSFKCPPPGKATKTFAIATHMSGKLWDDREAMNCGPTSTLRPSVSLGQAGSMDPLLHIQCQGGDRAGQREDSLWTSWLGFLNPGWEDGERS